MEPINEDTATGLDFVEALATCIHDIKNSAGVVINAAESIQLAVADKNVAPHVLVD